MGNNGHVIDRKRCNKCFACVDECPANALERSGKPWTVEAFCKELMQDKRLSLIHILGLALLTFVAFGVIEPYFARASNILDIFRTASIYGICALGLSLVLSLIHISTSGCLTTRLPRWVLRCWQPMAWVCIPPLETP